jgi:hypothetical protein
LVFLSNLPEADKSLRYVQKIILGILHICLWLFFSHALILNKNPQLWMDPDELYKKSKELIYGKCIH